MVNDNYEYIDTDNHVMPQADALISDDMKMANAIYENIAHGDEEHRQWLKDKLQAMFTNIPKNASIEVSNPEFSGQFTISPYSPDIYPDVFDPSKYPQSHDAPSGIGIKYDKGKPRPSLLPVDSLMEVVKVLEFGANKYGKDNWQDVAPPSRYYDAALRHLFAWASGEAKDSETGLSHFAHAATCLLFLLYFDVKGKI